MTDNLNLFEETRNKDEHDNWCKYINFSISINLSR